MFKIGDIVKPINTKCPYLFKITSKDITPFHIRPVYFLKWKEQKLDPIYGPINDQKEYIHHIENAYFEEDELELTSNVELRYDITDINIPDYTSIVLDEMEKNLLKLKDKVKEEKEMKILDLYEERKIKLLDKELLEAKENVKKEDEIQSIILEMTNQVNTILENQGSDTRYVSHPNLYTLETELKIDELNDKHYEQIENLRSTLEEIRALFEMTEDYQERMKILKKYGIINKDGKLSI